ncbi:MAG: hypothetical protein HUK21_07645 [Fibrobacteraceae bacterium]|nr:hypothetical protein [Fibrobacteraceae bacterium]
MQGNVRFAPSPTGYLHRGHILSALYVWAFAQKHNLNVHLRIEDHDQSRMRPEYVKGIKEDLEWLGFKHQTYSIQSKKDSVYQHYLQKLQEKKMVYPCTCSRKKLQEENPISQTGEIIYQGACRFILNSPQPFDFSTPHALRFCCPDKKIEWNDLRLGSFQENPAEQCGDFTIKDRHNQWTYQFAVCCDDIDENITHIVRGEDIRNSTARQIALMDVLGRPTPPVYYHHPLIVDASGKKLSKRELAHSIRQDKDGGINAEALLGLVCYEAQLQETPQPLSLDRAISIVIASL